MRKHKPQHMKPQPTLRSRVGASVATVAVVAGLGLAPVTAPVVALAAEASTTASSTVATDTVNLTEEQPTYDGNVAVVGENKDGVAAYIDGGTVNGNVRVEGEASSAVTVFDGSVTVNGDVSGEGVHVYGLQTLVDTSGTINGDVSVEGEESTAVSAYFGSNATVNGDVSAEGDLALGVRSEEARVTVNGNVDASGEFATEGVYSAGGDSVVTVNGNVTAEGEQFIIGVYADLDGAIVVRGDVTSDVTGAIVQTRAGQEGKTELVVEGALLGGNASLVLSFNGEDSLDNVPTVVVGSLEKSEDGKYLDGDVSWETEEGDYDWRSLTNDEVEDLLKAVYYIVDIDGFDVEGTQIVTVDGNKYAVANEGDVLTLTPLSGYKFASNAGAQYQLKDNGDGTYSLTVQRGGNVTSANLSIVATKVESGGMGSGSASGTAKAASYVTTVCETLPATGDATGASALGLAALAGVAAVGAGAHLRRREE